MTRAKKYGDDSSVQLVQKESLTKVKKKTAKNNSPGLGSPGAAKKKSKKFLKRTEDDTEHLDSPITVQTEVFSHVKTKRKSKKNMNVSETVADESPSFVDNSGSSAEETDDPPKTNDKRKVSEKQSKDDSMEISLFGDSSTLLERLPDDPKADEEVKEAAWLDEADGAVVERPGQEVTTGEEYVKKRRKEYSRQQPAWASLSARKGSDESSDEDGDDLPLERQARQVIRRKRTGDNQVQKNVINYKLIPRAVNGAERSKFRKYKGQNNPAKCVQFHPASQVLLIAPSHQQRLHLYQVDGDTQPLLHTVAFDRFSCDTARFDVDGGRILVGTSVDRLMYVYDMHEERVQNFRFERTDLGKGRLGRSDGFVVSPAGDLVAFPGEYGFIHLRSSRTFETVESLKANANVTGLVFSPDGSRLFAATDNGNVYVWSMKSRVCEHVFKDEGCIKASSIAASPCGRYLSVGSSSGVLNLYETHNVFGTASPKPKKSFMNLTTDITNCAFNSTSAVLGYSSAEKRNAFRLVHTNSCTVYGNIPSAGARFGNVCGMDFSRNSGYLALGNNAGFVNLFRLTDFSSY